MKPIDAKTDDEICKLPRDNFPASTGKWTAFLQPHSVSLHQPNGGGWVEIPREQWDVICKWYMGLVP